MCATPPAKSFAGPMPPSQRHECIRASNLHLRTCEVLNASTQGTKRLSGMPQTKKRNDDVCSLCAANAASSTWRSPNSNRTLLHPRKAQVVHWQNVHMMTCAHARCTRRHFGVSHAYIIGASDSYHCAGGLVKCCFKGREARSIWQGTIQVWPA